MSELDTYGHQARSRLAASATCAARPARAGGSPRRPARPARPCPRPPAAVTPSVGPRRGDTPACTLYANLGKSLDRPIGCYAVDPVRNPYAPGAGQRPPELAGRDVELTQFEVVLERVARGRPE